MLIKFGYFLLIIFIEIFTLILWYENRNSRKKINRYFSFKARDERISGSYNYRTKK